MMELKRKGAMNIYNIKYCEFLILEKLQAYVSTSKDKTNLFYKRLEYIRQDQRDVDEEIGVPLISHFAFKCKIVRDVNNKD
jgi:hypothetical protein